MKVEAMGITDLISDDISVGEGGLRFRSPYRFDNREIFFVCPICKLDKNCGPSNSTNNLKVASELKREHEARHTGEFYRSEKL